MTSTEGKEIGYGDDGAQGRLLHLSCFQESRKIKGRQSYADCLRLTADVVLCLILREMGVLNNCWPLNRVCSIPAIVGV